MKESAGNVTAGSFIPGADQWKQYDHINLSEYQPDPMKEVPL
jgi:hypothetical protein